MTRIDRDCFATLEFQMTWESEAAKHREHFLARKVNIWRDFFPPGMEEALIGLQAGDTTQMVYAPGQAVAEYSSKQVCTLAYRTFRPPRSLYPRPDLRFGRFYPKGFLSDLIGIYPQNIYPFRVIGIDEKEFRADMNHPLAAFPLTISVKVHNVAVKDSDVGGRCSVWMEELADKGPGMQGRWKGLQTDFGIHEPLAREDEQEDSVFYSKPRIVGHVDAQASEHLQAEYGRVVQPGMRVLDLMSSVHSHLPPDLDLEVTGLGMNAAELQANPMLGRHVVHDVNTRPELPFADASFDIVICSLSVEYITWPQMIIREIRRVLSPRGLVVFSFSNRWFPPKVTRLWTALHEFERMGFVLELLLQDGGYKDLETTTVRNWWRPADDRWYGQLWTSDPVYVVRGTVAR